MIERHRFNVIEQMHFLFTYGTNGGTPEQLTAIRNNIGEVLKSYPHYQALGNTIIVKVNSPTDWTTILHGIAAIAQKSPIPMNFLLTPFIASGSPYNGWMPKPAWDEINKLTQ